MKDEFNNQFATRRLRQTSDKEKEAEYLRRQKEKEEQENERIRQLFAKHGVKPASINPLEEEGSVTTTGGAGFTSGPIGQPAPKATKKVTRKKIKESDVETKLAAGKAKVYMKDKGGWEEAPSIPNRPSKGGFEYKDLWEELNENYSRFRNETKTRTKEQQFHTAVRLAEKKILEANRILEYTAQLKSELSVIKENKNTQKLMERITRGIAEAYGKMKKLK